MNSYRHQNAAAYREGGQTLPPVSSESDRPVEPAAAADQELQKRMTREVAVLFTDIRGSSIFFKIHGDIAGRLMMQRHYDMLFPLIEGHQGTVVKTVGDSIMATFYDPFCAVAAAVAMQRELFEYNARQSADDPIRIRIGINFGTGIIEENDVFGDVVNMASKLVSMGESEQIVVSESVRDALADHARFIFFPLKQDNRFYGNLSIAGYAVRWHEKDQVEEKEMTILSLAMIGSDGGDPADAVSDRGREDVPDFFRSIEKVARERAFRTTMPSLWKLQAVFEYAETAVDTAIQILRLFRLEGQPFHMGIHTGRILVNEVDIVGGEEAGQAREKAGPGEIYLTQETHVMLKDNLLLHFLPLPASLPNGLALHKLLVESPLKSAVDETYLKESAPVLAEWFEGGSTRRIAANPSEELSPQAGLLSCSHAVLLNQHCDAPQQAQSPASQGPAPGGVLQTVTRLVAFFGKTGDGSSKPALFKVAVFASRCFIKFFACFSLCTLSVSTLCCFILMGYEGYAHPPALFSREVFSDCLRFGLFCGTLFGAGATLHWLYNNFDRLPAKRQ